MSTELIPRIVDPAFTELTTLTVIPAECIADVLGPEHDQLLSEREATMSAEALMRIDELYGEDVAQVIGEWSYENDQQPHKVIDNILTPLGYLALGFTIKHKNGELNGREIFGRTD